MCTPDSESGPDGKGRICCRPKATEAERRPAEKKEENGRKCAAGDGETAEVEAEAGFALSKVLLPPTRAYFPSLLGIGVFGILSSKGHRRRPTTSRVATNSILGILVDYLSRRFLAY